MTIRDLNIWTYTWLSSPRDKDNYFTKGAYYCVRPALSQYSFDWGVSFFLINQLIYLFSLKVAFAEKRKLSLSLSIQSINYVRMLLSSIPCVLICLTFSRAKMLSLSLIVKVSTL